MAAEMRTIRVCGLPVNMSANQVAEKIHIHFLDEKNGGGKISSVTMSKSKPGTALISFEESKVALRLAKQERLVFRVNDKSYDVKVSLHHEEVDPDQVILQMSVTVDHSKLPEGKRTLFSLHKTFPDIHLTFDPQTDISTLSGRYNDVQSLSSLVLHSLESQKQDSGDGLLSRTESPEKQSIPLKEKDDNLLLSNKEVGVARKAQQNKEFDEETENQICLTQPSNYIPQSPHKVLTDDRWDLEPEDGTMFEDFSLDVDSDIFRYLHKHCAKEYQSILRRHRVDIVDVTYKRMTTLYSKPKKSLSNRGMSSVKNAHEDLANLFQVKGSQLRKENISKSGVSKTSLEQALESLKQRLPKLMVDEDEGNVLLVGSKSDVSEAKQFITDGKGTGTHKDAHSDHLFSLSPSTSTFSHQVGPVSSERAEQANIFQPLQGKFQDLDDLFNPRKNHQKAKKEEIYSLKFADHTQASPISLQAQTKAAMDEDIFSTRRNYDTTKEEHIQSNLNSWNDEDRYTDSLLLSAKLSSALSTLDLDKRTQRNPDFISGTTLNGLEKQFQSNRNGKTKPAESGREQKMAANFSKQMSRGDMQSVYNSTVGVGGLYTFPTGLLLDQPYLTTSTGNIRQPSGFLRVCVEQRPISTYRTPTNATAMGNDMTLRTCICGWTKVTTYKGLRIHQGKMKCL